MSDHGKQNLLREQFTRANPKDRSTLGSERCYPYLLAKPNAHVAGSETDWVGSRKRSGINSSGGYLEFGSRDSALGISAVTNTLS